MFDVIVMREPSITSFNHVIRNYDVRQRERQEKAAETKEKELRKEKAFHIGKKGRQSLWTQERTGKKMPDGDAHAHPKGRPKFRGGTTGSHPFWRELQVPLPSIVSLRAEVTTVKLGTGYVFVCVYVLGKNHNFYVRLRWLNRCSTLICFSKDMGDNGLAPMVNRCYKMSIVRWTGWGSTNGWIFYD